MFQFQVEKRLDQFQLAMDFVARPKEILVILGRSGSGKSTLLNLISGLHRPDQGRITGNNRTYVDTQEGVFMPIYQRNFGYIQQKSNLFPHLTTYENIIYGMKEQSKEEKQELEYYIQVFGLEGHLQKYPRQLSGGQQQRVSIIRALVAKPDLLLFDEPFSALDNVLRTKLREKILELKEKIDVPMIFVTHDLEEAYLMGDEIILLDQGTVIEHEEKYRFFHHPTKESTARFIGINNILPASLFGKEETEKVALRPNKIKLFTEGDKVTPGQYRLEGEVTQLYGFNHYTKFIVHLTPSGQKVEVQWGREAEELIFSKGMRVWLGVQEEDLINLEHTL